MKWLFSILLLACVILAHGQLILFPGVKLKTAPGTSLSTSLSISNRSEGVDFSTINLVLASSKSETIETTGNPLTIRKLTMNGENYALQGDFTVTDELIFTLGNLLVEKTGTSAGTLTYAGSGNLEGRDESYVNGRIFMKGGGVRTFPIGTSDNYLPVSLETGDANVPLGFEVVARNPTTVGFAVPQTVKQVFPDHFWEFSIGGAGNSFAGSNVSLSSNLTTDFFVADGDPVILEKEATGEQKSLGGVVNTPFISSASPMSGSGKYYALAKSDEISVIIYKLITPDKDSKNDALYIQGIDAYPENEVTLLDRWGVVAANWKNFKNDESKNFVDLAIGNYICILKYVKAGQSINVKPQMISVLK